MKKCTLFLILLLFLAFISAGQSIITPVFVLKDGDATVTGYTGSQSDIYINGGTDKSVGWITFQTDNVDCSKISSAKVALYLKSVKAPGTLRVYSLSDSIKAPENNVLLTAIVKDQLIDTVNISSVNNEAMLQFNITSVLKSGKFKGVALSSDNGLEALFDSKEGNLAPLMLLSYDVASVQMLSDSLESLKQHSKAQDDSIAVLKARIDDIINRLKK